MHFCLLAAFTAFGENISAHNSVERLSNRRREGHIAHEKAIYRNPPVPNFAGDEGGGGNWTDSK
jgi:hypothetical protein